MTITAAQATRRVATYERVSSEDQRERETIKTQTDVLARALGDDPGVTLVQRFVDDGVSGTIPLAERPAGRRLMAEVVSGRIDEVRVYKFDRLGRDAPDLLKVGRGMRDAGVALRSVVEGEPDLFMWDILSVVADNERRTFLRKTADGLERAVREGRYVGGVVAFGYRVEGKKPDARLVPDDRPVAGEMTAVDVIRLIYERIAIDDRSCQEVADELNALDVPTHRQLEGTGTRRKATRGLWRGGRIRNMVVNPLYRGEAGFGQRNKKRATISAEVPALVSKALWQAAQETLARHRICAHNPERVNLLKSLVSCSNSGHKYVGSVGRDGVVWYRCGGQLKRYGPNDERCIGRSFRADHLEPVIWQDVDRWLRQPGDLLSELDGHVERDAQAARLEAEAAALRGRLDDLRDERHEMLRQRARGRLTDVELDDELVQIDDARELLDRRLEGILPTVAPGPAPDEDLLHELRNRLDVGLSELERQEIVRLLIGGITITTTVNVDGTKDAKAMIAYNFPAVVETRTAKGSWRR